MRVLVTGGCGFIGSALVRRLIRCEGFEVINVDKLTYAGNLASLDGLDEHPKHHFEKVDICNAAALRDVFERYQPEAVFHLAAESHVDRSIEGPSAFLETNIQGTYTLLEATLRYWIGLSLARRESFRFVHISTDEVYGSLGPRGLFTEDSPHRPNSPYAATKAASDHLVRAWHKTFGLPTLTTNCTNNYGPYQYPEKLIPLVIKKALSRESIPVYGTGDNVRDWLYVEDHVDALITVLLKGKLGRTYNIGGRNEKTNLEVVREICQIMDGISQGDMAHESLIHFVEDRPGHDKRYAMDTSRIEEELEWFPKETFETGLRKTVQWYLENKRWCEIVSQGRYSGERLGTLARRKEEPSGTHVIQ